MTDVATFERTGTPRATVTRDGLDLTVVVDNIAGLSPNRAVSAEEAALGIESLNPPTATSRDPKTLIDLAELAVEQSAESSDRDLDPGEFMLLRLRVTMAVAGALRMLTEPEIDV